MVDPTSDTTKHPLVKDYEAGIAIPALMKRYRLTRAGVYFVLKREGYTPNRHTPVSDEEQEKVCTLYERYRDQSRIVNETGFSKQKVSRLVQRCPSYKRSRRKRF